MSTREKVVCQGAFEIRHDGTAKRRGAEVRDWRRNGPDERTNAADPNEQKATHGTAGEGMPLVETTVEEEVRQDLGKIVPTLLENALLGNMNCAGLLMGRSEKAGQARASEKELPGMSIADAWLAEPEWMGESSEAQAEMAAGSREPED